MTVNEWQGEPYGFIARHQGLTAPTNGISPRESFHVTHVNPFPLLHNHPSPSPFHPLSTPLFHLQFHTLSSTVPQQTYSVLTYANLYLLTKQCL